MLVIRNVLVIAIVTGRVTIIRPRILVVTTLKLIAIVQTIMIITIIV